MTCTARAQVDEIVRRIMEENELEKLARMQKQQETKEYSTHPPPSLLRSPPPTSSLDCRAPLFDVPRRVGTIGGVTGVTTVPELGCAGTSTTTWSTVRSGSGRIGSVSTTRMRRSHGTCVHSQRWLAL